MPDIDRRDRDTIYHSSRRGFVKAAPVGATIALAGCLGRGDGEGSEDGSPGLELNSGIDPNGNVGDRYEEALHQSGMPEDIEMNYSGIAPPGDRLATWEQWFRTSREKPDILQIEAAGPRFIERDGLLNLSEYISDDVQNEIEERMDQPILRMYMQDGDLYGVPWLANIGLVHYRKDLVEEAGYDPDGEDWMTNPLTWQEFNQVIKDTLAVSDVDYGFSTTTQDGPASGGFYEMVYSFGGDYFGGEPPDENVQQRPVTVTEQPVINALKLLRAFIYGQDDPHAPDGYDKITQTDILQWGEDPPMDQLMAGNEVAMRSWVWPTPILQEEFGDAYGTMPMPSGVSEEDALYPGYGGSGVMMGGWAVAGNANTNHPEAVGEFIEAMITDHAQLTLFDEQGYAPPATDLYASDEIRDLGIGIHANTLQHIVDQANTWPLVDPLWREYSGPFNSSLNDVLQQQATPEDAMSDLKEIILNYQSRYSE